MNIFPASNIVLSTAMLCLLVGAVKATATEPTNTASKIASVEQLLNGLKTRLNAQPDDVKGWVLLAKSYHHLGYREEATQAAAKARELGFVGEILPLPSGHPVVSPEKSTGSVKSKKYHHQGFVGSDAGSYVSSFFAEQEKQQAPVNPSEATKEAAK